MNAPTIEYAELLPMLIVFGAAIIGVLIEAFVPRRGTCCRSVSRSWR